MPAYKAAGFQWIRTNLWWTDVECSNVWCRQDPYNWTKYDALKAAATANGMRMVWILCYGSPEYAAAGDTASAIAAPDTPQAFEAYARFAAAAVARYGPGDIYELWNEPNLGDFWGRTPNAVRYTQLAGQAAVAMRAADPRVKIWGLSLGGGGCDYEYSRQAFGVGLLSAVDAISVHPYCVEYGNAPSHTAFLASMRELMPRAKELPLVVSEWGTTALRGLGGEHGQAARTREVLRQWDAWGVSIGIIHTWEDACGDQANEACLYGLFNPDGTERPVVQIIRTRAW